MTPPAIELLTDMDRAGLTLEGEVSRRIGFINGIYADLEARIKGVPGAVNPFDSSTHVSLASQQLLEILQYADPSKPLDLREVVGNFALALAHIAASRGVNVKWRWPVAATVETTDAEPVQPPTLDVSSDEFGRRARG